MTHTIVLVELTAGSRTYDQYATVRAAMNGVCQLFEKRLKLQHPNKAQITYDIKVASHDSSVAVLRRGADNS